MKKFRIQTIKKLKRINQSIQRYKGRKVAQLQEILMEGQAILMNIPDNQLRLGYRAR